MNKKAQMEILGLAIIVVLISMGILFALSLGGDDDVNIEAEFEQKNLAASYINTLLGTTTSCYQATFRELIQDCAQGGTIYCDGVDSCGFVIAEFDKIAQRVLAVRKATYSMRLKGPGPVEDISSGLEACPGELTPGIQYIPTRQGTVTIRLDLCQ